MALNAAPPLISYELSLTEAGKPPRMRMRTLLSMWSDGLAPLPESLVSIDATSCTNTSSGLDVHVLNRVASIERGVGNAAPHKSVHRCKMFFTDTDYICACADCEAKGMRIHGHSSDKHIDQLWNEFRIQVRLLTEPMAEAQTV
jgi:hypothetical protein